MTESIRTLGEDRAVVVVRAPRVDDPGSLVHALAGGGIRSVEFTFTTPGVGKIVRTAVEARSAAVIGLGTVLTRDQAKAAVDHGAEFLVTPGVVAAVAAVAVSAGIPLIMGAMTPSEVISALDLGADVVKIFPASSVGPSYIRHLRGPFPNARFLASGGIDSSNAREFMTAGCFAVAAGSSVVSAAAIESNNWDIIDTLAREFVASLS